ncbi:tetratricopeptide repeat protein [Lacinutrix salivirga]
MKKYVQATLILFFIGFQTTVFAQENSTKIKFDTKYYDAVDKWIAFPKQTKDSIYAYGFIYIDEVAGLTFQLEDFFKLKNDILVGLDTINKGSSIIKNRLSAKTSNVYILTEKHRKDLKLPKEPDWLGIYKKADDDVEYLKQLGYHYNHIGASHNALKPLLKAYALEPHYEGLEFELGFAYNALQQFEKAIPVLEKAIKNSEKNHLLYKELGYAYTFLKDAKNAEKVYTKGIKISENEAIKCEMAVNMSQLFFNLKNKKKFKKWAAITRKYGSKTPQYLKYIDYFEKELQNN